MNHRTTPNGPLVWSALFIGAAIVLVLTMLPSLLTAAVMPSTSNVDVSRTLATVLEKHDEARHTYEDRFTGRSVFFKPKQPRKPVAPRPPRNETPRITTPAPEPVETEPVKPAKYLGPDIQAMIGNHVWFDGGLRITVGDEANNGIRIVSVNAPWSARVEYNGWEYDVDLFRRFSPVDPPKSSGESPDFFQSPDEDENAADRRRSAADARRRAAPQESPARPDKPKIPAE